MSTEIKVENGFKSFLTSQLYKSLSKAVVKEAGFGRIHSEFRRCHALLDHQNKLLLSSVCYWENFVLFQLSLLALLRKPPEKQRVKTRSINAQAKRQNPKPFIQMKYVNHIFDSVNTGDNISCHLMPLVFFQSLHLLTEVVCNFFVAEKFPPPQAMKNRRTQELEISSHCFARHARDTRLQFAGHLAFETPNCGKSNL